MANWCYNILTITDTPERLQPLRDLWMNAPKLHGADGWLTTVHNTLKKEPDLNRDPDENKGEDDEDFLHPVDSKIRFTTEDDISTLTVTFDTRYSPVDDLLVDFALNERFRNLTYFAEEPGWNIALSLEFTNGELTVNRDELGWWQTDAGRYHLWNDGTFGLYDETKTGDEITELVAEAYANPKFKEEWGYPDELFLLGIVHSPNLSFPNLMFFHSNEHEVVQKAATTKIGERKQELVTHLSTSYPEVTTDMPTGWLLELLPTMEETTKQPPP